MVNTKGGDGFPDRTFDMRTLQGDVQGSSSEAGPSRAIQVASSAIREGHLVAFPTETVYGLGANALDERAVSKIFAAKNRPADNPLIVHISDLEMLQRLVPFSYKPSAAYEALMQAYWPGPLTFLVPADVERVPSVVRCGLKTLGVRMPKNELARSLIATADAPLAAPSANVSGRPSPTTAQHVAHDMTLSSSGDTIEGRIPYILDGGPCEVGLESTVIDGVTDWNEIKVLRPGGISVEQIQSTLYAAGLLARDEESTSGMRVSVYGKDGPNESSKMESAPTTPGMKYRHYSPNARVVVLTRNSLDGRHVEAKTLAQAIESESILLDHHRSQPLMFGLMITDDSPLLAAVRDLKDTFTFRKYSFGTSAKPEQAAHRLFDGLRTLDGDSTSNDKDGKGCAIIFVEAMSSDDGVCLAIMNRLNKAASSQITIRI